MNLAKLFLVVPILFMSAFALAAPGDKLTANNKNDETAEILSSKSYLEDILVKRYTQGLSTIVDQKLISVGAQLEVSEIPPDEVPAIAEEDSAPFDLTVGNLDSDLLTKKYANESEKRAIVSFLTNKKIKAVLISVGLKENLGPDVKASVEKWISVRTKNEFGDRAKTEVTFVKEIPVIKEPEAKKNWIDWLNQFQQLAGIALFALTVFLVSILWRLTSSKVNLTNNTSGEGQQLRLTADGKLLTEGKTTGTGGLGGGTDANSAASVQEQLRSAEEAFSLTQKINALVPKVNSDLESIIQAWCNGGEEGKIKLAAFADAVGRETGKLPIPKGAVGDMAKHFATMSKMEPAGRKKILDQVYWDIVTVMNLGSSSIEQPFSYLAGTEVDTISDILMNQNSKLKTLVSLYLPEDVRKKFMAPLTLDQKIEMLENAAKLKEISSDELSEFNASLRSQMTGDVSADQVKLDMTFDKIVSMLDIFEEFEILPKLQNDEMIKFKKRTPSIAFLHEWPDDKLGILMTKLRSDEIVTYLRFKPDQKDRILKISPPMTAEVVSEDFEQKDRSSKLEKEAALKNIVEAAKEMIVRNELDLSVIFQNSAPPSEASNVVDIKSA